MVHLWHLLADACSAGNALLVPPQDQRFAMTEVLDRAERTASDVLAVVERPRRVGVLMANGEPWLRGVLTALRLDAAAVPLPLPVGFAGADAYVAHLRRVAADASLDAVLVDSSLRRFITSRIRAGLDPVPLLDITEPVRPHGPDRPPCGGGDELAVIQYTSGSTSAPKGVTLTHRNVASGLNALIGGLGFAPDDVVGLWVPLFHDMGLFMMLSGLANGSTVCLWRPADFVRRPLRWLTEFVGSGATVLAAPNFCYEQLVEAAGREPVPELDLSRWRLATNAAEMVRPATQVAFEEIFGRYGLRPGVLSPGYGMAEATLIVSAQSGHLGPGWRALSVDRDRLDAGHQVRPVDPDDPAARTVVGCGPCPPEVSARIGDETGTAYPDGTVGEVQITGTPVTGGYLNLPPAQQPFTPDGWLRTGDLAFLDHGELFIVGRLKDMITVRGQNYYAEDVEEIVRATPGIERGRRAAIAVSDGSDERIVVLWETAVDPDRASTLAESARERVRDQIGLAAVEVVPVAPTTIPHTSSGKVRRRAALQVYLTHRDSRPVPEGDPR